MNSTCVRFSYPDPTITTDGYAACDFSTDERYAWWEWMEILGHEVVDFEDVFDDNTLYTGTDYLAALPRCLWFLLPGGFSGPTRVIFSNDTKTL